MTHARGAFLWLAFVWLAFAGCAASSSAVPAENGPGMAEVAEDAFTRPWAFVDRVDRNRPIQAIARTPQGFVAIVFEPTDDARAMPPRNNIAAVSADAVTWEQHRIHDAAHVRGLAFGDGVLVAVGHRWGAGTRGTIFVSRDGRAWTEVPAPDRALTTVSFLQGRFWALGQDGGIFVSADGRTWEDRSRPTNVWLTDIAYGAGRYVIVGNALLSSADGVTWSERTTICDDLARCPGAVPPGGSPPGSLGLTSIVFGQGTFLTAGSVGTWASSDGLTWTEAPGAVGDATVHGRLFVGTTRDEHVVASSDGRAWATRTSFVPTDDNSLSCAERPCVVTRDGVLVVPREGDPAPLRRLPALSILREHDGQRVAATIPQTIHVTLSRADGQRYGTPQVSSTAVRFDRVLPQVFPVPTSEATQTFRLFAAEPGVAEIRVPDDAGGPAFTVTITVTTR